MFGGTKLVVCYYCGQDDPKCFMAKHKRRWYHKPKGYGIEVSCLEKAKINGGK